MQELKFNCKKQVLTLECPGRLIVADSKQQVYARFSLDEEWDGLTVTAIFTNAWGSASYKKLIGADLVEIPPEVLAAPGFRVSLHGSGNNGAKRLPTAYMDKPVAVHRAGALIGMTPEDTTPELWEQVLAAVGNLSKLDTKDKSNLVAAINEVLKHGSTEAVTAESIANALGYAPEQELAMGVAEVTEDGGLVINVPEGTAIKTGTQICYRDPSVIENAFAEIASNYAMIDGKKYLFVGANNVTLDAKELHEKNDTIIIRIDEEIVDPLFAQVIAIVPKEQKVPAAVLYDQEQTLTDEEKEQVQKNIGVKNIGVMQTEGSSETAVMSQKAVTNAVQKKIVPLKINGIEAVGNLIPHCVEEVKEGHYCVAQNGKPIFVENANYTCYKIRVALTKYYFARHFIAVCDVDGNALNDHIANITSIDISNYPTAEYVWYACSKYDSLYFSRFFPNTRQTYISRLSDKVNPYARIHVETYESTLLLQYYTSLQKGLVINVSCDLSSDFTYAEIGFIKSNAVDSVRIRVTNENLSIYDARFGGDTVHNDSVAHGLTIVNNLQIYARYNGMGNVVVEVVSNGLKFSKTFFSPKLGSVIPCFRASTAVSNIDFSFTCEDFEKEIWAFGDSYFQYDTTRWAYNLLKGSYGNNVLMNFYSGANSDAIEGDLETLIKFGTPKYVLWCLGMNDGADTDVDTPSEAWKTNIEKVINICKSLNITPILATIPTVPNIYHEGKNKWVRNSGYQYVDFAKAVGANDTGEWYDGMLSSDGIHPAIPGGLALYHQVLTDFPQIMIF